MSPLISLFAHQRSSEYARYTECKFVFAKSLSPDGQSRKSYYAASRGTALFQAQKEKKKRPKLIIKIPISDYNYHQTLPLKVSLNIYAISKYYRKRLQ
jgi:hypothetical protein